MPSDTLTSEFARFVNRLSYSDLSENQIYKIKTFFLDWLGSAYAGQNEPPVRSLLEVVRGLGGTPESTIIPDNSKTMSLLAALANGASSHVVEMDDLHRESVFHPAAAIMPAVFALAEKEKASGPDLIMGILVGYEVGIRIAMAVGQSHYHYWHTTATCGTFGAAAGAAKILGLDEEQFIWTLGSAGTQAAGLWEFLVESAMSKQLHPGKAALNGVLSALLAQKGFTGARKILEGEKGFFRATSTDFDEKKCVAGLGREFMFERNSLKYYASCGHTHSYVYQAAIDLLGDVEAITPYVAKFNLPFCLATALRYGHVDPEDFTEKRLEDPEIGMLMERVNILNDPALNRSYPEKWPARVEIFMDDGRHLRGASDYPKGEPENPLTEEELFSKFKGLTSDHLSPSAAETLMERCMNLEKASDVGQLLDF
ncbi:MAG: MmgE/PrpD family protein [Deltaproteobacteria bacterium]|nr:MmgE/PrpD family protein [Deltaproteobacteria bacterium]